MKELSIEEKAKRYDEIIEKANKMHSENCEACQMCIEELIPELKESEDEKHRKWILEYLYDGLRKSDEQFKGQFKCAIAWLEKQSEQNPNPCDGCINRKGCINCENGELRETEQKPVWSEEDEDMRYKAIAVINRLCAEGKDYVWSIKTLKKLFYWLKSLKDRVQPQPKQEWSEEDYNMLGELLNYCEHSIAYNGKGTLQANVWEQRKNWLKSLRPQNRRKPSDEQMRILDLAIRCGINRGTTEETTLVSLFNDLKKLKEG